MRKHSTIFTICLGLIATLCSDSADSIHLRISDKTTPFKYTLKDNSLYLYNDVKKEDRIRREMLHAKPW